MSRRIVLVALGVVSFVLFASLEFSGVTQAASGIRQTLDSSSSKAQKSQDTYCRWDFSHYESSAYEEEWFSTIDEAQHNICKVIARPRHAAPSALIVRRIKDLFTLDRNTLFRTYDTVLPMEQHQADIYMSRMHYTRSCYDPSSRTFQRASGAGIQLIEPLWGMLRDPFDLWCRADRLTMPGWTEAQGQSKQHIMPQGYAPYWYDIDAQPGSTNASNALWRPHGIPPWHSSLTPEHDAAMGVIYTKPRNIHLDLGASYFGGWTKQEVAGTTVNPAASGQYFYDAYHARGQPFDAFLAVEVEVLNDTTAYQQVPADLVGKYNLINVGLTMEPDGGDQLNTIGMIKRIVRPGDFFVFKLDIDSAPIEMPIIQSLLHDDPALGGASALVDELMFEHHVDFAPMNAPWTQDGQVLDGSLAESFTLFKDLRNRGIRAHSWP